jgi:hypothetical protein
MPTRSTRRLPDIAAAVAAVAAIGWALHDVPSVTPAARLRPSQAIAHFAAPARVRLETLNGQPSQIDGSIRDPFSRRHAAAMPIPPAKPAAAAAPIEPPEMPTVPPAITAPFKFMGILQRPSGATWGVFADCGGYTRAAREGESVLGTWRVLRIGAESVFIESLDEHRLTLPLSGCGPRS